MSHFKLTVVLILISVFFSACGDLKKEQKKQDTVKLSQFNVCKLDYKKMTRILTHRIDDQIHCLGESLNLFINVVKTDRPGYLSLKELKGYIKIHIKDMDADLLNLLDTVFAVSGLLFGENPEYISKKNVGKLISLMDYFNQQIVASSFHQYFRHKGSTITYAEHNRRKAAIFSAFTKIGKRFAEEVVVEKNPNAINIKQVMRAFESEENRETMNKTEKLLFLKPAFLRGQVNYLTAPELKRLAQMLGDVFKIGFDLAKIDDVEKLDSQEEEIIKTLKADFEALLGHIAYQRYEQVRVFNIDDVLEAVDTFMPSWSKYTKYKKELLKVKEVFLESRSAGFSPNEIYILLDDLILKNLKRGAFFYRAFALNKQHLQQTGNITTGIKNSFYISQEEKEFKQDFDRIAKDYRHFKGMKSAPIFKNEITRTPFGMFETAVVETIVSKVMSFYGNQKTTAKGGYSLTLDQMVKMFTEYEDFFYKEDIIKRGYITNSVKSAMLISSLFQSISDGDAEVEVDEFTEFLVSIYSSFNISGIMHDYLLTKCDLDTKGRFTPQCFRSHFRSMMHLKDNKGYKINHYLPKLFAYMETLDTKGRYNYYMKTENFTRTCTKFDNGEDVPMKRGDLFLVLSGMFAIEQTMIRFDENNNNVLDVKEVDKSYSAYAMAVKAIVPVESLKKYSKDFYLYLMKYKKLPQTKDVGFFRLVGAAVEFVWYKAFVNQSTKADRETIAVVLKIISEQSNSDNPFPCELLR